MEFAEINWEFVAPPPLQPGELAAHEPEAAALFRADIQSGMPWGLALLEAVGRWTLPQETWQGRHYQYLLLGEAFDWLLLAERLCAEVYDFIPADELEQLLFYGQLPEGVTAEQFSDALGINKRRAHLNYWYGVVLEEALQLAVEDERRKRRYALCYADSDAPAEEAFLHLYVATRADLLEEFRAERKLEDSDIQTLTGHKEFTYWLFKRRLRYWDPARVASDTRKGLQRLQELERLKPPAPALAASLV